PAMRSWRCSIACTPAGTPFCWSLTKTTSPNTRTGWSACAMERLSWTGHNPKRSKTCDRLHAPAHGDVPDSPPHSALILVGTLSLMKNGRSTISLTESMKIALLSMATHKLRTGLTLLGVIIAVTTLIAVVSVIEGMDVYVAERVS